MSKERIVGMINAIDWEEPEGIYAPESGKVVRDALLTLTDNIFDNSGDTESTYELILGTILPHVYHGGSQAPLAVPALKILLDIYCFSEDVTPVAWFIHELNHYSFRRKIGCIVPPVGWLCNNDGVSKNYDMELEREIDSVVLDNYDVIKKKCLEVYNKSVALHVFSYIGHKADSELLGTIRRIVQSDKNVFNVYSAVICYSLMFFLGRVYRHEIHSFPFDNVVIEKNSEAELVFAVSEFLSGFSFKRIDRVMEGLYFTEEIENLAFCYGKISVLSAVALLKYGLTAGNEYDIGKKIIDALLYHKNKNERSEDDTVAITTYEYLCEDVMGYILSSDGGEHINPDRLKKFQEWIFDQFKNVLKCHTYSQIRVGLLPDIIDKDNINILPLGELYRVYEKD